MRRRSDGRSSLWANCNHVWLCAKKLISTFSSTWWHNAPTDFESISLFITFIFCAKKPEVCDHCCFLDCLFVCFSSAVSRGNYITNIDLNFNERWLRGRALAQEELIRFWCWSRSLCLKIAKLGTEFSECLFSFHWCHYHGLDKRPVSITKFAHVQYLHIFLLHQKHPALDLNG